MAVFHHRFLDAYFVPSFYKMILGKKVTMKDLEAVDYELWRGLSWMLYVSLEPHPVSYFFLLGA